jgi:hypothetical protein
VSWCQTGRNIKLMFVLNEKMMMIETEVIKETFIDLERIVPIIDKIGSGFPDAESTALALLLFFKEEKVLDTLSHIRKKMSLQLSSILSEEEYEQFIEQDISYWDIPYNKDEILNRLKK